MRLPATPGIDRPTKDVDVFAKAGDALKMLHLLQGARLRRRDRRRALARPHHARRAVRRRHHQHADGHHPRHRRMVRRRARKPSCSARRSGWSRRRSSSGRRSSSRTITATTCADVAHMILKCHDEIDWKQLLSHMELYWEVLLMALLNFRFVYPSERARGPALDAWTSCSSGCATRMTSRGRARRSAAAASSRRATMRSTSSNGAFPKP